MKVREVFVLSIAFLAVSQAVLDEDAQLSGDVVLSAMAQSHNHQMPFVFAAS